MLALDFLSDRFIQLGFWLTLENPIALLLITLIYTFLLLAAAVRTEFTTRRAQEQLTADSGKLLYKDEDEHWIYGMFYCNPNDRHFIVNNRIGLGTSVNIAKLPGKNPNGFFCCYIADLAFYWRLVHGGRVHADSCSSHR